MPPNLTNLTITDPLVLYRSLIATNRIKADPTQHRLALHLQKVYERLIDYEPSVEYSQRLRQLSRVVASGHDGPSPATPAPDSSAIGTRGIWTSLLAQKEKRDSLALTRVLTSHEAALDLQSPKGLMLHGEVGTGKSMLIDLFADCLPNRKKRRWHFNTFMLDTFSRLEHLRKSTAIGTSRMQDEYSLLWLARDLIQTSPVLFLDEFQLPDRAASKILSNLLTSFFQLGGVLITTSNRMPEELAKAAGIEFARPISRLSRLGWSLGLGGVVGRDDGPGQKGEFAQFLEVLRARCEIWEMEGRNDYRRPSGADDGCKDEGVGRAPPSGISRAGSNHIHPPLDEAETAGSEADITYESSTPSKPHTGLPKHYFIEPLPGQDSTMIINNITACSDFVKPLDAALRHATSHSLPIPWTSSFLTVYGRKIPIPQQYNGVAMFSFSQLCSATLGPADYTTLASTYHTIILTAVPVLTFLQKNEARRFITLLDALYEARCRLIMTASAGPDDIFFPEPQPSNEEKRRGREEDTLLNDAVHPETYSEIHQDLTSPFRPNISSYSPSLSPDALEDDPPHRVRRAGSSFTDERRLASDGGKAPDFANIGGLTGEDERFAVKRAQSRIWEMCSGRWWDRASSTSDTNTQDNRAWWRPLPLESRHWERGSTTYLETNTGTFGTDFGATAEISDLRKSKDRDADPQGDRKHAISIRGASPLQTVSDAPPKIDWTHAWGTVRWGKRAGVWGKGVEGLGERRKEKEGSEQEAKKQQDR